MSTQPRRPAISRKAQHPVESLLGTPVEDQEDVSTVPAMSQAPEPPPAVAAPPTAPADTATTQLNSRITVDHRRALEEAMLVMSAKRGRRLTLREVIEEAIDGLRTANDLPPVRPIQTS